MSGQHNNTRGYLFLVCLFLGVAWINAQSCEVVIRNITVISFPFGGGVEITENQDVIFDQFSGLVINVTQAQPSEFRDRQYRAKFVIDGTGEYLLPGFIDSNTHLFQLEANEFEPLLAGLSHAIDMGSTRNFLTTETPGDVKILKAGSRLSSSNLDNAEGDAIRVDTPEEAEDKVQELLTNGAMLITVRTPIALNVLEVIVNEAHASNIKVAVKALTLSDVQTAVDAGADILQHTPLEILPTDILDYFAQEGRAIVSTLSPYQGAGGIPNLINFRNAGGTILYGSNLGAEVFLAPGASGINQEELALLYSVFNDSIIEVYRSATIISGEYWGFEGTGVIEFNNSASFIMVPNNPLDDFGVLANDSARVFTHGRQQNCRDGARDCFRCPPRVRNEVVEDDTFEIVIGVVIPVISLFILLAMITAGLVFHFAIRRPKNKRKERRTLQEEDENYYEDEESILDEEEEEEEETSDGL